MNAEYNVILLPQPPPPPPTGAINQWALSLEWRHTVTLHILVGKICITFFPFSCEACSLYLVLWLCGYIRQRSLLAMTTIISYRAVSSSYTVTTVKVCFRFEIIHSRMIRKQNVLLKMITVVYDSWHSMLHLFFSIRITDRLIINT